MIRPEQNQLLNSYLAYINYGSYIKWNVDSIEKVLFLHQTKVNFETVTKLKNKLYSIYNEGYIAFQNLKETGYGGTCFSNTLILHDSFAAMKLDPQFLYLKPDHFALAINLNDNWFYIDVSFWAPLFKIYPLEKNWEVEHNGLKVGWEVDSASGSANLMRNGQIAKQWDGSFSNKDQFLNLWNKSIMNKNYFNSTLLINRWLDRENFIFLKDRTYRISSGARLIEEKTLDNVELTNFIIDMFNVDPYIYISTLNSTEIIQR